MTAEATIPTVTANGTQPVDSWAPINLNTLPDQPPVQPTLGNIGIVYPGKRHVFSGPQESAKTLAAYAIGLQVVRHHGRLILIDFEMGAWDARNRLRELGATPDDLAGIDYLEPAEPALPTTMPRLLEHQPQLVIIDAAAGAFDLQGLDDNKRQDVEKFTRLYVRTFWQAGVATIVLDHVVKNTDTRGKYAIGSERKVGGADVHLGFEVITPISRGKAGLYKIVTHKDRGGFLKRGTLANMRLDSDNETHAITWAFEAPEEQDGEWKPTKLMVKVSEYLAKYPEGQSRTQTETAIGGNHDYVRRAMDALVELGHAREEAGPRNSRLLTFITSYEEKTPEDTTPPDPARPRPGRGHLTPPDPALSYRRAGGVDAPPGNVTPPDFSWLDELTPDPEDDDLKDLLT